MSQNSWGVSYSNISFVERALDSHSKVADFKRLHDIVFEIDLIDGRTISMVLVNEYTLGLAAIHRALSEFPDVEYVVTCANWNGYTRAAKKFGRENGIGVFVIGEFFGALHWADPKKYVQKDKDGNPIDYYRSP
jgi:hypothetical protein